MPSTRSSSGAAVRAAKPRDLCRGILRAQGRDHRQRHDDVADRGQLDDEDGARHGRAGRPLSARSKEWPTAGAPDEFY